MPCSASSSVSSAGEEVAARRGASATSSAGFRACRRYRERNLCIGCRMCRDTSTDGSSFVYCGATLWICAKSRQCQQTLKNKKKRTYNL